MGQGGRSEGTGPQDALHVFFEDDLIVQQGLGQSLQLVAVARQNVLGAGVGLFDHRTHFLVDDARRFLAVRFGERILPAAVVVAAVADAVVQSVDRDHGVGLLGDLFEVTQSARRDFAKHDLLRRTAAERRTHFIEDLLGRGDGALLRQVPGGAEALASGHDAHLDERRSEFHQPAHHCVTGFVEGDGVLLVFRDDFGALFQAPDDAVHRIQEVLMRDQLSVFPSRKQRRLVAHVGDVCPAEARGLLRQEVHVHAVVRFDGTQVHVKNGPTLVDVGHVHVNLTVKATGTHQRFVQDVCPVGGGQNDDPAVGAEAVHLRQELVQRVFALVVGAKAGVLATGTPNGVDFIDEDDGGRFFLGLLEQIANP